MLKTFRRAIVVSTAIAGLSGAAAMAAPPGATDLAAPRAPHAAPGQTAASRDVTIEQRIADLYAKLQITAAQKPQWDSFAQVMRDNAKNMSEIFQARHKGIESLSAAENMKSYAGISMQHAQDMQKLSASFETLYGTMSEPQKKVADTAFRDRAERERHG